jgi:hypothetical protein
MTGTGCGYDAEPRAGRIHHSIFAANNLAFPDGKAHPQIFTLTSPPVDSLVSGCTGTLIASNVVLTAGHCTDSSSEPPDIVAGQKYVRLNGTYTLNVDWNAGSLVVAALGPLATIEHDVTASTGLVTHPDYVNSSLFGVDVALLILPEESRIPRCAMNPLRIVEAIPDPPIVHEDKGTFFAWRGMMIGVYGGGVATADCSGTTPTPIHRFTEDILTAFPVKFGWAIEMRGGELGGSSINHICPGDSGGPVLTDNQSVFGTNLEPFHVVGVVSSSFLTAGDNPKNAKVVGPLLPAMRPWLVQNALDRDADGIEAWDDNCDTVANPSQLNSDNDCHGGDACDICPADPHHLDHDLDGLPTCADPCPKSAPLSCPAALGLGEDKWGDADHDGICNADDSCPCAKSIEAFNCNSVSELDTLVPRLPDACDPVPCASFRAGLAKVDPNEEPDTTVQYCKEIPADFCPLPSGQKAWLNCWSIDAFELEVRPLASHDMVSGKPTAQPLVPTTAWFCHKTSKVDCEHPVFIDDKWASSSTCVAGTPACADPETVNDPFHRMTIFTGPPKQPVDPNAKLKVTYDFEANDLARPPLTWLWDFDADFVRWTAPVTQVLAQPPASADLLFGTAWLHAETNVGATEHGKELANHYEFEFGPTTAMCLSCGFLEIEALPDGGGASSAGGSGGGGKKQKGGPGGAGKPGASELLENVVHLVWRPVGGSKFARLNAVPGEASYVVASSSKLFMAPTAGEFNCGGQIVNDALGGNLMKALLDPAAVWASAVEPLAVQGFGETFPLAVALSAVGGSELLQTATSDGARLLAEGDRAACPPAAPGCEACASGSCNDAGVCCDQPCVTNAECASGFCDPDRGICAFETRLGSPNAVNFIPVLTRMRGGVFVVGGEDPATGEPTGEIWFTRLQDPLWGRIGTGDYAPERVLASTYSFATDRLYVLDETAAGEARLVAVDLQRLATTTLGTWKRHGEWNRQWLVVDRDGAILLASSTNAKQKMHRIARLDVRKDPVMVVGIFEGKKALVAAPIVDAAGYTLLLQQSQGNTRLKSARFGVLAFGAATLADVGVQL